MLFDEEGFKVRTAVNGRAAMSEMDAVTPDLVLLDYMMPLMDGAEVFEAMQANERLKSVPVIVMSAVPEAAKAVKGANAYLAKPFDVHALLKLVATHLG